MLLQPQIDSLIFVESELANVRTLMDSTKSVTVGSQDLKAQLMVFIHLMVLTYIFVDEKTAKCVQVTSRHAIYLMLFTLESKRPSYLKSISLSTLCQVNV